MQIMSWRIEWTDALSMSNPQLDAQHQHFFALINKLNRAINDRRDKAEIERIMNLLLEDAVAHFAHEERLFAEREYPRAQEHAQLHAELINTYQQALKKIQQTEFSRVWIYTGLAIKTRLVEHVLIEDTRYIAYLRSE